MFRLRTLPTHFIFLPHPTLARSPYRLHSSVMSSQGKTALVLLSEGNEEMETVIPMDILRRAGVKVTLAGLNGAGTVTCSRNVKIVPDTALSALQDKNAFDAIILPGGLGGAEAFAKSKEVHNLLESYHSDPNKTVAIICASPIALQASGVAKGKTVTSHPSVKEKLTDYGYKEDRVVVDGNLITSRGPGTAFEFALAIVKRLQGVEKAREIIGPMVCHDSIASSL
ncbi:DJ-1-like protein [Fimicolochytrium jonesii]|uniref:DJ-1-like protein n=1 Tax=Fimicolochytrium jonesii TaxID=1396493 RepID=UPI0022FEC455|nr:DJ-1-like protein [Fimicolochytrium jonesii]KAI8817698.1 DJ-1-like protein [Fimicolochytrium jonesii]